MPLMLPLSLLGAGYLIYLLLAGATLALPVALGAAAGVSAYRLGCSPFLALMIGACAFMSLVAGGRFAALTLRNPSARLMMVALFSVPAALAGYSFSSAFGLVAGLITAVICALVAAHRLLDPHF